MCDQPPAPSAESSEIDDLKRQVQRLKQTLAVVAIVAVLAVLVPWVGCFAWIASDLDEGMFDDMPGFPVTDEQGKRRATLKWTKDGKMEVHLLDGNSVWKVRPGELEPNGAPPTTTTSAPF